MGRAWGLVRCRHWQVILRISASPVLVARGSATTYALPIGVERELRPASLDVCGSADQSEAVQCKGPSEGRRAAFDSSADSTRDLGDANCILLQSQSRPTSAQHAHDRLRNCRAERQAGFGAVAARDIPPERRNRPSMRGEWRGQKSELMPDFS